MQLGANDPDITAAETTTARLTITTRKEGTDMPPHRISYGVKTCIP
jgi:hypothetical protein